MKKAGIIGGIGPASTVDYYNGIISQCYEATGEYPTLTVENINMNEMIAAFDKCDYNAVSSQICAAVDNLAACGCDFAVIASNTPHIIIDMIREKSALPIISIVEETCLEAVRNEYKNVLVTGTAFTMKSTMYSDAMRKHGINAVTPDMQDIEILHGIIFPNLENGIIIPEDKLKMITLCEKYIAQGIDAVVLGCTEIPLMIKSGDLSVSVIDTTQVHINASVKEILNDNP